MFLEHLKPIFSKIGLKNQVMNKLIVNFTSLQMPILSHLVLLCFNYLKPNNIIQESIDIATETGRSIHIKANG